MKKLLLITILSLLLCNKAFSLPKCQGEDISKWNMCKGIKKTSKGSKYTGEFKDGKDPTSKIFGLFKPLFFNSSRQRKTLLNLSKLIKKLCLPLTCSRKSELLTSHSNGS